MKNKFSNLMSEFLRKRGTDEFIALTDRASVCPVRDQETLEFYYQRFGSERFVSIATDAMPEVFRLVSLGLLETSGDRGLIFLKITEAGKNFISVCNRLKGGENE